MSKISRLQPRSVNCSGTYFSLNTLDAINSLLANVVFHSKGSQPLELSDLIITFHIELEPFSPLNSAGMRTQIQNFRA